MISVLFDNRWTTEMIADQLFSGAKSIPTSAKFPTESMLRRELATFAHRMRWAATPGKTTLLPRLVSLKLAAIARTCPPELLGTVAQFAYAQNWRDYRPGLRDGRAHRGSIAGRPCWWLPERTVSNWRHYNTDTTFCGNTAYSYDEWVDCLYTPGVARLPHRLGYGVPTPDDVHDTQESDGLWVGFVRDDQNGCEVALLDGVHARRKDAIEAAHSAAERAAEDEWEYREREREEAEGEEEEWT